MLLATVETEWIGAVMSVIGGLTAIVGVGIATWQLSNANKQIQGLKVSLRMNALAAVLQIENELRNRMARMVDIGTSLDLQKSNVKPNQKKVAALERHLNSCIEQYINAADRLAFCIKNEYVPDQDWRPEYRDFLSNIVRDYSNHFGPDSIYTNIIDLNGKWKRV